MTTDLRPTVVDLDTTAELVSDQATAMLPTSQAFREASRADRVNFSIGLRQNDGTITPVQTFENGSVMEYELSSVPSKLFTVVQCRDASAAALDKIFRKSWVQAPPAPLPADPDAVADPWPATEVVVGLPTAETVAREAATFAGLELDWQVPNYTLKKDYHASKRVIEVVRDMAAMWQQVAPFQARIIQDGMVLRVVPQYPLDLDPPVTLTLTATQARQAGMLVRLRPLRKVGRLTLSGAPAASTQTSGHRTVSYTSETRDIWGITSRIVTTEVRRFPDINTLESMLKDTYTRTPAVGGFVLRYTMQDRTYLTYEDSNYANGQRLNTPTLLEKRVETWGAVLRAGPFGSSDIWMMWRVEDTQFDYDPDTKFLRTETTTVRVMNFAIYVMENSTQTIRTIRMIDDLFTLDSVDSLSWDSLKEQWVLLDHQEAVGGGNPPGGPGRGSADGGPPLQQKYWINHDDDAVDVEYTNEHMGADEMTAVAAQHQAADLLWEFEAILNGVASTWFKRLDVIEITGWTDDLNNPISVPKLIVLSRKAKHDESKTPPTSYLAPITLFGWRY